MEEGKKHIDDLFRNELGGYTETPPSHVWESLEQRLDDGSNHVAVGVSPYRWLWFALALLLLALLTTFGFYVAKRVTISEPKKTNQQNHNNLKVTIATNQEKQATINNSFPDSNNKQIDKIHFANANKDGKLTDNNSVVNPNATQKHIGKKHRHENGTSVAASKRMGKADEAFGSKRHQNNSGKGNLDSTDKKPSSTYTSNTNSHKRHNGSHTKVGEHTSPSVAAKGNLNSKIGSNDSTQNTGKQVNNEKHGSTSSLREKNSKHHKYSHTKVSSGSLPIAGNDNPAIKDSSNNNAHIAEIQSSKKNTGAAISKAGKHHKNLHAKTTSSPSISHVLKSAITTDTNSGNGNNSANNTSKEGRKKRPDLYATKAPDNSGSSSNTNPKTASGNNGQTSDKELDKAKVDSRLTVRHSQKTHIPKSQPLGSNSVSQSADTENGKTKLIPSAVIKHKSHTSASSKDNYKHKNYVPSDIASSGKPIDVTGDSGNSDSLKAAKAATAKRKNLKIAAAKFGKKKEINPNGATARTKKLNDKAAALGKKRSLRISPDSSGNTKYYATSNTTKSRGSKTSSQSQSARKVAKTTKSSGARHHAPSNNNAAGISTTPPAPVVTTPTSLSNNNNTVAQTTPSKSPQQLAEEKRESNLDMSNYQNAALNNQNTDTSKTPKPGQNQTDNGGGGGGGGDGNPNNTPPVAHKRTSSKLEGGLKAGYELGMASYKATADKYVISPYLQYNVSDKFALLFQPGIKFDQYKNISTPGTQSYYNVLGYLHDSVSLVRRNDSFPDSFSRTRYYTYKENSKTVTVSYSVKPKTNWEIELPILLKFQVTHGIYIYGGVNLLFSNAIQTNPSVSTSPLITTDTTISFAPIDYLDTSKIPSFSTRPDTFFTHKGQPYSSYTSPPTSTANALQMGYIVGLNFVIKDRLLLDVMVQQSISPNNGILSNFRSIYTQPYIRFTIGYKLFGK